MAPTDYPAKPTYKSYRKKYLKMRHGFKAKMRESNTLFDDEQATVRIAHRLQEQSDQLLELLHTCNQSHRVPPPLRYTLSPTPSPSAVPSLEPDDPQPATHPSPHSAHAALEEARQEFSRGEMSPARFREIASQLKPYLQNPTPLSSIFNRVPHTTPESFPPDELPPSILPSDTLAYLTPSHEDTYLSRLDVALWSSNPEAALTALDREHPLSAKDNQRDHLVRNPVSAYNWLRKHRPVLFSNTDSGGPAEAGQERKPKPSPKPNTSHPSVKGERGGGGRGPNKRDRESGAPTTRLEPEMLDEEGNVIGGAFDGAGAMGSTGRGGKRKRGEDDAYRPKGGSSRPGKRKRAGTGTGIGPGKGGRASGSGGAMMEDE
ncbi:MAG: hypothetical protein LQ349_009541 [Xanthoria aureola]|nr:MAG: hypothetical protein LQ349_009541 [Xanthoria aureola]